MQDVVDIQPLSLIRRRRHRAHNKYRGVNNCQTERFPRGQPDLGQAGHRSVEAAQLSKHI